MVYRLPLIYAADIPDSQGLIRELQTDGVMAKVRQFLATAEVLWSGLEIKARGLDYAPWAICYFKAVETYLNNRVISRENPGLSKYTRTFGELVYCINSEPRRYLRHPGAWGRLDSELNSWRIQIRNSKTHKEPVHSRAEAARIRTASLQLLVRLAQEML